MKEQRVESMDDLRMVVDEIVSTLPQKKYAHIVALRGELGVGKTTFTQLLAKKLGVHEHVTSPTFVIMRTYKTQNEQFQTLIHIDVYRVEDVHEVEVLHIPKLFRQKDTIICIEWPERIASLLPDDIFNVTFELQDDGSRKVVYGS